MNKKTIDARGQLCPKPLILTKKALKEFSGTLEVLLDNETAFENVSRFLNDTGTSFIHSVTDGEYTLLVNSEATDRELPAAEDYCPVPQPVKLASNSAAPHVICFKSRYMGEGDDKLGGILIQAFCNTISEAEPLPGSLVFYNSGIFLALKDSKIIESLQSLEKQGVRILVCGTCLDYYGEKENIGAGLVSNMYDIMQCLTSAGHVICP